MQKIALISIKPKFANQILFGVKRFEYRKRTLSPETTHIILYMTAPVKKIVGIATIHRIHSGTPANIWEQTKHASGLVKDFYNSYFKDSKTAYAIELETVMPFNTWIDPKMVEPNFKAPQSFKYVSQHFLNKIFNVNEGKIRMTNNLIFLAGIHGVGKGYFCDKLLEEVKIPGYGASQLIREGRGEVSIDKKVGDVQNNQDILLEQIQKKAQSGLFILEGHFCLLDKENNIEDIPLSTFHEINPKEIFLLEAPVKDIQRNLNNRDSVKYDLDLIARLIEREREYSLKVASELDISIRVISHKDTPLIIDYLKKTINEM